MIRTLLTIAFLMSSLLSMLAGTAALQAAENFAPRFDVTWHELGEDEYSSMPLGNGDIALNAWTEPSGDLVLLIAKNDAWSENAQLLKVGRVRISLSPNPFKEGQSFEQKLNIKEGVMTLKSTLGELELWVDANHPAIRVASKFTKPVKMTVKNELWRNKTHHLTHEQVNENVFNYWSWRSNPNGIDLLADTVLPAGKTATAWCHFNSHSMYPVVFEQEHLAELLPKYPDPLLHRCFGAVVTGSNLKAQDDKTLVSKKAKEQYVNIHVMTEQAESPEAWLNDFMKEVSAPQKYAEALAAHKQWWKEYWQRSWIQISGDESATQVEQSYAIQRYMNACQSRGIYPMKFNGGAFCVGRDVPEGHVSNDDLHDPDFRQWGGCFWHQNTRHLYYPLTATGDYDLLQPWFNLYLNSLPLAKDRTRLYFGHGGASYIETILFWGLPNLMDFGWNNPDKYPTSGYMRYHTQGALEVILNMLEYYENVQDAAFLKDKLLPFAEAIMTYYNEHWKRGEDGKILFDPHQVIEMYQTEVVNPLPDIAALRSLLPRLQQLPSQTEAQKQLWATLLADVPVIPLGKTQDGKIPLGPRMGDEDGKTIILPAYEYNKTSNQENPELYAVFPYRNYCVGKPDLQIGIDTYFARRYPFSNCWGQDGMEAALLGLADEAKACVTHAFTTYSKQKFKWFWAHVADYEPDMDNGGNGMETLQLMLMQTEGKTIRLLPAWPKEWIADFKLHAPYNTVIKGHVENGKLTRLDVTPKERLKDVVME